VVIFSSKLGKGGNEPEVQTPDSAIMCTLRNRRLSLSLGKQYQLQQPVKNPALHMNTQDFLAVFPFLAYSLLESLKFWRHFLYFAVKEQK